MPVGRSVAPAGRRRKRRAASLAAAAAVAVCAAAVFFFRAAPDRPPPPPAQVAGPSTARVVEPAAAAFPPPPEAGETPSAAGRDPGPCEGCLNASAARDVAETLVAASGGAYLDVRVERAHDLTWYTKERRWPPVPTDGLVDAPEYFSFGPKLPGPPCRGYEDPNCRGPREEWWIVWFHVGWRHPREVQNKIDEGVLPEVALAWPPIKREEYIIVDAFSGRIESHSGGRLFFTYEHRGRPPLTDSAYRAAEERARHYLGERARGGPP